MWMRIFPLTSVVQVLSCLRSDTQHPNETRAGPLVSVLMCWRKSFLLECKSNPALLSAQTRNNFVSTKQEVEKLMKRIRSADQDYKPPGQWTMEGFLYVQEKREWLWPGSQQDIYITYECMLFISISIKMSHVPPELCGEILSHRAHNSWCLSIPFDVLSNRKGEPQMVDLL